MVNTWIPKETNTHQDHVIAHVLGTTVLAYFVHDEVIYLLLDIGFVWNIFLDGEMGLLPHPVAVSELDVDDETRDQLRADIDVVLTARHGDLKRLQQSPTDCLIEEVTFVVAGDRMKLVLAGKPGGLEIKLSLERRSIEVSAAE
ncbi:MAG TPA: hypothetical protein VLL54_19805 [Pyrinomonadaceae bacterium]|nr:hypothetical protein [Pyrinomonadaceae bacterium]